MKWCLNRPQQSKNSAPLKRIANLSNAQSIYKQPRPSNILKFEKIVAETVRVLEEYLNPFEATLDESCLYNLSSGEALPAGIADDITKCYSKGLELMQAFTGRLLENGEQKFHDLVARNKIKSFKSHVCSKVLAKDNKTATIRVNRDISGSLLSFSAKNNKPIDWENALSHPLSPIPLCLSIADGKPRKTAKKYTARSCIERR